MSMLGGVKSTLGTPFTFMGSATRHMMNIDVTWGRAGASWNEREEYRNQYTAPQRAGAGFGNVLGTVAPVVAIGAWAKSGMRVPGLSGASLNGARAVGVASLATMAYVGQKYVRATVEDDGDLRSVGGVVTGLGAGALAYKLGGKWGPIAGLGAGIAGAFAGYEAGKLVNVGPGHVGKDEHVSRSANDRSLKDSLLGDDTQVSTHTDGPGRAIDFGRGMFTHFAESGPLTQGVSFGYTLKQQQHFREDYSQTEQGGAINGDLLAATVLGGGAVGLTRAMLAKNGVAKGGLLSKVAFESQAGSWITKAAINAAGTGGGKVAIGAGALALAGGVAAFEGWQASTGQGSLFSPLTDRIDGDSKTFGVSNRGLVAGGLTVAATAGAAMLLKGRPVVKAMGGTTMAAGLGAAVLVSALSSARVPVQHLVNDVRDLRDQRKQDDPKVAFASGGVGMAAGAVAGMAVGKAIKPGLGTIAGGVVGAAAGGALGYGMAPALPNLQGVGLSAGVGAAALGTAGLLLTHDVKSAGKAAAVGGVLGTLASPMLTHGAPAKAPGAVTAPAVTTDEQRR
jgi:hypothetical protein